MFQGHRKVAQATGKEQEVERVFADYQQALHFGALLGGGQMWFECS